MQKQTKKTKIKQKCSGKEQLTAGFMPKFKDNLFPSNPFSWKTPKNKIHEEAINYKSTHFSLVKLRLLFTVTHTETPLWEVLKSLVIYAL